MKKPEKVLPPGQVTGWFDHSDWHADCLKNVILGTTGLVLVDQTCGTAGPLSAVAVQVEPPPTDRAIVPDELPPEA